MVLKIAIENPQNSENEAAWRDLGSLDPTRISADHEWDLVQALGADGAQIAIVFMDEKPILRFLFSPFLSNEGTAGLGFFALAPEASDALLQEGFQLALQRMMNPSMTKLVGPINGNTWFSYRLRTDRHPLQFDWEPKGQPRLENLLTTAGFSYWAHYHSLATAGLKDMKAYLKKDWTRVVENGFSLRRLSLEDLKTGALFDLHRLSQVGFAENPLFVPLSFEGFARSYLQGKTGKENFIYMASDANGQAVAFFLAFLEPAHMGQSQRTLVLKTAATDPAFRRQGLSNALLYAICQDLPADVSDNYISALVFQGWTSESFARHGQPLWEHQYVLLAKDLT